MWHSATAAAVALLQQPHLLIGGLGGVIAVIVGGVVSIITLRNSRRSVARPAMNPQPAPASRRPAAPPVYGAPAPPTSPARRLHPGPISLSAPTRPQRDNDDQRVSTSLFNPDLGADLGADAHAEPALPDDTLAELGSSVPLLRPSSGIVAEWRAQAAPPPAPDLTHAPIWNRSPFAQPEAATEAHSVAQINFTIAPPIWAPVSARMAAAEPAPPDAESLVSFASHTSIHAPIWDSWLCAPDAATHASAADEAHLAEARNEDASGETDLPIWPSSLRTE
ncbi:MAG TPA: hypothetical protein VIC27_02500 [Ktedonobacterales bacterium]